VKAKEERETGFQVVTAQAKNSKITKSEVRQDALKWAEFLYSEFKREKALSTGVKRRIIKEATNHDKPKI
jgi:hypothetical protein